MVAATTNPPSPQVLLFDTNILIIYAREGEPYRRLEAQLGLRNGRAQGIVSVITVGEALAFARKRNWGVKRREMLTELIRTKLAPIDINRPEILAAYAEIDHYCEKGVKPAHPMGQNDLWIAATAHVLNCELVTTDKDFDHLHGQKLRRRWIDPESLKSPKSN
jgi:tRNA(fMet)-specific endonuclease VapC